MIKKHWSEFELIALLAVVVLTVSHFHRKEERPAATPTPVAAVDAIPRDDTRWQSHFLLAGEAIGLKDWVRAEGELREAHREALLFPAHDKKLAETLDDLGLVYFSQGRLEDAVRVQGQAVASLLLARGPSEPELQLYIQRYQWAVKQLDTQPPNVPVQAYEFLAHYDPGMPAQRYQRELQRLRGDYEALGQTESLEALERL